jgi:hypothetical protein
MCLHFSSLCFQLRFVLPGTPVVAGWHAVSREYDINKHNKKQKHVTPLKKIQSTRAARPLQQLQPAADNPRLDPGHIDKKQMAQKQTANLYLRETAWQPATTGVLGNTKRTCKHSELKWRHIGIKRTTQKLQHIQITVICYYLVNIVSILGSQNTHSYQKCSLVLSLAWRWLMWVQTHRCKLNCNQLILLCWL